MEISAWALCVTTPTFQEDVAFEDDPFADLLSVSQWTSVGKPLNSTSHFEPMVWIPNGDVDRVEDQKDLVEEQLWPSGQAEAQLLVRFRLSVHEGRPDGQHVVHPILPDCLTLLCSLQLDDRSSAAFGTTVVLVKSVSPAG